MGDYQFCCGDASHRSVDDYGNSRTPITGSGKHHCCLPMPPLSLYLSSSLHLSCGLLRLLGFAGLDASYSVPKTARKLILHCFLLIHRWGLFKLRCCPLYLSNRCRITTLRYKSAICLPIRSGPSGPFPPRRTNLFVLETRSVSVLRNRQRPDSHGHIR